MADTGKIDSQVMSEHPGPVPVPPAEQKIYADVYDVLLFGMLASSALFAVGVVLALIHPHYIPLTKKYVLRAYHWTAVWHGLAAGSPQAFMMVATVVLILTPVARVVISVYAFLRSHDHKYAIVTSIVLLVIILTVMLGWLGLR
jgi:uncharacterized membrane protein